MIRKYIKIYFKYNIMVAAIASFMVSTIFFVIALCKGILAESVYMILSPFAVAAFCVIFASLTTIRFREMIELQEQAYQVVFQDTNVEQLEWTLFLSDMWIVSAGYCAIYKKHILSIDIKPGITNKMNLPIYIRTLDGKKHTVWVQNSCSLRKMQQWLKTDSERERLKSEALLKEILGESGMAFLSEQDTSKTD